MCGPGKAFRARGGGCAISDPCGHKIESFRGDGITMPFRHGPVRHRGQGQIGLDKKRIVASLKVDLLAYAHLQGSSPR